MLPVVLGMTPFTKGFGYGFGFGLRFLFIPFAELTTPEARLWLKEHVGTERAGAARIVAWVAVVFCAALFAAGVSLVLLVRIN